MFHFLYFDTLPPGTVVGEVCAGGLVGYASYTEFDGCSAKAEVSASGNNIGGFIGEGFEASFTGCAAEGSVTGSWSCGGFAGEGSLDSGVTGEETAGGLANICEDYYGGHQLTQKTEAKDPTCTEPGNKEYWTCERCGKHFRDENDGMTEITDVTIPATGHHYVNGTCTVCGEKDPDYRPDPISYYGTWDELKEGTQPGEYPVNNIWTHIYIKAEGTDFAD